MDKNYNNPVPNGDVYEFTQLNNDIKNQSEIDEDEEIFTDQELLDLLKKAKARNLRDFILFSLLTVNGARISEILSIKIKNINLQENYFETGFEKGARKTTSIIKRSLVFFIPKRFVPYLEKYIHFIGEEQEWLFPGRKSFYKYRSFSEYVKINYGSEYNKFHKFRRTLITKRVKMFECPLWISEGSMNHVSSST